MLFVSVDIAIGYSPRMLQNGNQSHRCLFVCFSGVDRKNMSSISFIYFDLGNVVCWFSHDRAIHSIARISDLDYETVKHVLFDDGLQAQYELGKITSEELHIQFCQQTNSGSEIDEFLEVGSDIFELNLQMAPLLTQLRASTHPMGLLSNTCDAHWRFISTSFPIINYWFHRTILSFQVGFAKPDPAIYETAIRQSGFEPSQILFIDDLDANVAGAMACGMRAIQFHSTAQVYNELNLLGLDINL